MSDIEIITAKVVPQGGDYTNVEAHASEKEDFTPPSVEPKIVRMAKLLANLREISNIDYIFRIAEGTVPPDDQRALDYFGIEK